jgi:hypothetical protein
MRLVGMVIVASVMAFAHAVSGEELELEYHGAGWVQLGKVEKSFVLDKTNDYNKNWIQNGGGQLGIHGKMDSNWDGAFGLGVLEVHLARGGKEQASQWYPFWVPYVDEARVTYSSPIFNEAKFQFTMGSFHYNYNQDIKNLGLYLMRGYVYPGALVSGFGSVFGASARFEMGGFNNDLILKSETEDKPLYDYSLVDVFSYRIIPGLEIGGGVNLYRVLSNNKHLTTPEKVCPGGPYANGRQCFIPDTLKADTGVVFDANGNPVVDSITGSLAGTKLMVRFHVDPKLLLGFSESQSIWGKEDWVIYGEAAVLGLNDYPVYYDNILRRIPVMVGFNIPNMGFLDQLSLEVEYYASKNSSDNLAASYGSWLPKLIGDESNKARDDWKWSINVAKTVWGQMQISSQVANDHLRLGGTHDTPKGIPVFSTLEDWYWICKIAYFF